MTDRGLRTLERDAAQGDSEAALRLEFARLRSEGPGRCLGPLVRVRHVGWACGPWGFEHCVALDPARRRRVVVKVLDRPFDAAQRAAVPAEAALQRRLEEAGLAWCEPVLAEPGERGGQVLPFQDAGTAIESAHPLWFSRPRPERVEWVLGAARALEAAHGLGAFHGRLSWFDLDRWQGEVRPRGCWGDPRLWWHTDPLQYPWYSAPELLVPAPPPVGAAQDVWSLGILLYEALTTRRPWNDQAGLGDHLAAPAFCERIRETPPRPPKQVDPSVSGAMQRICLRALARDPSKRFPSAGAFADAVERARPSQAEESEAPPPPLRSQGLWSRLARWIG